MSDRITQSSQKPPVFLHKENLPYGKARERLRVLADYVGRHRQFTEYELKEIRQLEAKAKVEAILDKLTAEKSKP